MRRLLWVLVFMVLAAGCGTKKDSSLKLETYQAYYRIVEENTRNDAASLYYTVSGEMTTMADGTHRYYMIVDEPKIAMYDIVVFVVENDILYSEAKKMMPCIGVFDDRVAMVPNQVNKEAGFVKGVAVSGECTEDSIRLKMLVEWKDRTGQNTYREIRVYTLGPSGLVQDPVNAAVTGKENV